ncbi:MAG: aminopeptidase P family protein [Bdellovibrio sp.]|nr:aminopeptidase P family protein [Bdellovibrio sp.]
METQNYQKRRQDLSNKFSRTLFLVSSGADKMRSHSVAHRFKVASDFAYLTGLDVPEALLVVVKGISYLLTKTVSSEAALWDDNSSLKGHAGLQGLQIVGLEKLEEIFQSHLNDFDRVAFAMGRSESIDTFLLKMLAFEQRHRRRTTGKVLEMCDSRTLVGALRIKKDAVEIELMKEAAQRSSRVHTKLMQEKLVGKSELDIANWIEAQFMLEGMQWTAYETIVGTGERSALLHARATEKIIKDGDMVLIDAGGEWQGYCADITRSLSANRKYSDAHKIFYNAVLAAQMEVIKNVRVGATLQGLHSLAQSVLQESLVKSGYAKEVSLDKIKALMPHSTSHWIGRDVHDPCAYLDDSGNEIRLEVGMTFTVEPALYENGIGVRIEDDVLVTEQGCEVLTSVPKILEEIEDLRSKV